VRQCYYVTGDWDFILIMAVTDMENYNALTRQLFFAGNNVKRFKTFVAMSRVKVGLSVPVGAAGRAGDSRKRPDLQRGHDSPRRRSSK